MSGWFWECPVVISLWTHVNLVLSSLLRVDWSVNPSLCLLNDDSGLCISSMQKRMLFAGFTAVKKTIIQNWFTPHMCRETYWIRSLLQVVTCECATARVGGAKPSTIDAWQCFLFDIRDYIKEWLVLCFSLPFDWTLRYWVYVCCFVLFCFVIFWMLCYVWKKNVDNKEMSGWPTQGEGLALNRWHPVLASLSKVKSQIHRPFHYHRTDQPCHLATIPQHYT